METRGAGGSRRLNVRGSALRSPFAVRNTMLFVRGFLLTEADGTSPMEWLEPSWTGPMSLVSGAAATTFGGAYGGALVVEGTSQAQAIHGHMTAGNTGSEGIQSRVNVAVPIGAWEVRASRSQNSGYRDHEWNERWQLELEHVQTKDNVTHRDWWAFQDGSWALPGAIKLDDNPMRSPGLDYDAHVQRRRALMPRVQLEESSPRRSLEVWTLARWTDKVILRHLPVFQWIQKESGGVAAFERERFATWQRPKAGCRPMELHVIRRWGLCTRESATEQRSDQPYDEHPSDAHPLGPVSGHGMVWRLAPCDGGGLVHANTQCHRSCPR